MKLPVDLNPVLEGIRSIAGTMGSIRDSVALLPDIAETLAEIQQGVAFMGEEVHRMRQGVDTLGGEVVGMRSAVEPLVAHLDIVAARVEALEPRLEDLSMAMHPLRRATSRRERRRATAEDDQGSSTENVSHSDGSPEE